MTRRKNGSSRMTRGIKIYSTSAIVEKFGNFKKSGVLLSGFMWYSQEKSEQMFEKVGSNPFTNEKNVA